jgi:hypothetical protein
MALLLVCLGSARLPAQVVINVTAFPAAQWGVSDATLGVTGQVIEDFEDLILASGLLVGWNTAAGNVTPAATLPFTFNPFTDDPFGTAFQQGGGGAWDGTRGLLNTRTNQSYTYADVANWGDILLEFTTPVTSVGFSLQQNEYDVGLFINGTNMGTLQTLTGLTPDGNRYGYIRIDAVSGTISSLHLINGKSIFNDGIMIDHLAFSPVPEPAVTALLSLGLAALAVQARRRRD